MAVSVDNEAADELLNAEWNRILQSEEDIFIDDQQIREQLRGVLNSSQLTYKYILVTNVLAKATNPDINYRAMQAQWEDDGAYNARSLGHDVLVEWEKANGERLGGSNEPFLNNPARNPSFSMDNSYRSNDAHRRLYKLLTRLEQKVNAGDIDSVDVLRQTLFEISQLPSQTIDFIGVSSAPYDTVDSVVSDYLETSGGGERLAAVTAGAMRAYYEHAGDGNVTVEAEHANVPDEFSEAAGDVEVTREGELIEAIEVKDKPSERSDIQHAITKGRANKLDQYLYLVGNGWQSETEYENALADMEAADIEIILLYPDEILSLLKFIGDDGRRILVKEVADVLDEMRAEAENKDDWDEATNRLDISK
ncbi:hypothetical protein BRC71_01325 [Halobacteriales archaeon QH_7_65_31]|nr:MAG: hypothetical protein BRC71_01325 [Halobacteriales archaeon QH_7_65_31]